MEKDDSCLLAQPPLKTFKFYTSTCSTDSQMSGKYRFHKIPEKYQPNYKEIPFEKQPKTRLFAGYVIFIAQHDIARVLLYLYNNHK